MNYINITNSVKILVYISLACTFITILLSKTKFISSIRYLCGLLVLISLVTVLSPFFKAMGELIDIDFSANDDSDNSGTSDELIINQSASYICEYVKTLLCQKYSISSENVSVSVTLDSSNTDNIIIKNITVYFKNTDESIYPEIAKYISDTVGCECIVISK